MKKSDKILAYKVVHRTSRKSVSWICLFNVDKDRPYLEAEKWAKSHPELFPTYHKGTVVEEAPGSVGLMCFGNREDAEDLLRLEWDYISPFAKIIEVELDRSDLKKKKLIYHSFAGQMNSNKEDLIDPPVGTIFCKKLKVLS